MDRKNGQKGSRCHFYADRVGGFSNVIQMLNQPSPERAGLDMFSIGAPTVCFVIGVILLIVGMLEASAKPYK
jgi:hypothetical protein